MLADDLAPGLSNATVRKHVFVLSGILEQAVVEERLARNPWQASPFRRSTPARCAACGRRSWRSSSGHPGHCRPLVLTAGYVGLRWGELAGLGLDRVDLLRRTVTVDRQLIEVGGKLSFGPPKTRAGCGSAL